MKVYLLLNIACHLRQQLCGYYYILSRRGAVGYKPLCFKQ